MKKYSLVVVSVILGVLFLLLYSNYSDRFARADEMIREQRAVSLSGEVTANQIDNVLTIHGYFDAEESAFVSEHLAANVKKARLQSIGDLNKRAWQLRYDSVLVKGYDAQTHTPIFQDNVPECFREKLNRSRMAMGLGAECDSLYAAVNVTEAKDIDGKEHTGSVEVHVTRDVKDSMGYFAKLFLPTKRDVSGVLVRLSRHQLVANEEGRLHRDSSYVIAWAKTDEDGVARFSGLDTAYAYSVVPLREGFEYGTAKGTIGGTLGTVGDDGAIEREFAEWDHRIRVFDGYTLRSIRADQTILVRTPAEFKNQLVLYIALFYGLWWLLSFFVNRRKKGADSGLIPIMMMLTGMCVLMMFSINNPLNDRLYGVEMAQGVLGGIVVIGLFQLIDFTKFYQDRLKVGFDFPLALIAWFFKPFRRKVRYCAETLGSKKSGVIGKLLSLAIVVMCLPLLLLDLICLTRLSDSIERGFKRLPKGSGYLLLALLLTAMLFLFGSDVGGMKVNLNLFGLMFQPSEIAKYLIVFFMAAFFAANADHIIRYSEQGNIGLFGAKMRMMVVIVVGLIGLMGLYLALGDMGPALVLATTFIILYSIVKSKIDLENATESTQLRRIFTCDLAMLFFGVVSFLLALYVGHLLGNMFIFCVAWFAVWIFVGYVRKEIFESAILFNFIIVAFIFGGDILGFFNPDTSAAKRLASRVEMCTNTWGTIDTTGANVAHDPGENTQVAEGMWGLASGGFFGQGLGDGTPTYIPAFHTDMVLESIGEQLGFIGVLAVVLLLAMLMRRTILLGYHSSHPFTFYLCLGVAIVTAVQFVVITLGSTGIIPLTGITVPFFSFGKVSLVLNLAAYGVILSISNHAANATREESAAMQARQRGISKYSYSVAILSGIYSLIILFIGTAFFFFMVVDRDEILIRPVYVNSRAGLPVVQYNPRIAQLTSEMRVGNIYDRNGILLATSDRDLIGSDKYVIRYGAKGENDTINYYKLYKEELGLNPDSISDLVLRRYYPFGDHLFFMLADANSKVYWGSETHGYMAESRHQNILRGYDDVNGMKKVTFSSEEYSPATWYSASQSIDVRMQLRDYSALLPYLKDGVHGSMLAELNDGAKDGDIVPKSIQLTVDAVLQKKMQDAIKQYMEVEFAGKVRYENYSRASVVIMDAENGDLLTSSLYPLPNQKVLSDPSLPHFYDDNEHNRNTWQAYTDIDMGLFHPVHPGSTAKVISSLAAIQALGNEATDDKLHEYTVYRGQTTGFEPASTRYRYNPQPKQEVNMRRAIIASSNVYFIRLINESHANGVQAYDMLADIYAKLGVHLYGKSSYGLFYDESNLNMEKIAQFKSLGNESAARYRDYMAEFESLSEQDKTAAPNKWRMQKHELWQALWGHNPLQATTLSMTRVAAAVVNGGQMPVTRFLTTDDVDHVSIVDPKYSEGVRNLETYMRQEAYAKWTDVTETTAGEDHFIGGKTGTATHIWVDERGRAHRNSAWNLIEDAWFICFVDVKAKGESKFHPIAIAVRIERGSGSGRAVELTRKYVLPTLEAAGYEIDYSNK